MSYLVTDLINDILQRVGRIKNESGITFLGALNSIQSLICKELLRRKSDLIVDDTLNLIIKAEDYKAQLPDGFIAPAEKFKIRDVNGNWILVEVTAYDSVTGILQGIITDFSGSESTVGFQIAKTTNSEGTIIGSTSETLIPGEEISTHFDYGDILISSVSGAEFLYGGDVIDFTNYIGKTVTVYDSVGNSLVVNVLSASVGETLGSELLSSWVNDGYNTLTFSGKDILLAIETSSGQAESNNLNMIKGSLYKFSNTLLMESGTIPVISYYWGSGRSFGTLAEGENLFYKTCAYSVIDGYLYFTNNNAARWSSVNSFKQVLTPQVGGVMVDVVSADTGFRYDDINGYDVVISDSVLGIVCSTSLDLVSGDEVILFNEETDISKVRLQPRYLNDSREYDEEDEAWNMYTRSGVYSSNSPAEVGNPSRYKIIGKTLYIRPKPTYPIQVTGKYFKINSSLTNSSTIPFNGLFDELFREGVIRIIQKGIAIPESEKDFMIFFNREFNTVVDMRSKILPKTRTHSSNFM